MRSLTCIATIFQVIILLATLTHIQGATTDETCLDACSDWSVVLGYCRGQWNDTSQQQNDIDYMNGFLACCCQGSESTQVLGNSTMTDAAETCLGCDSTPWVIKDDLSQFTTLCAVQAQNGSASDAINFRPEGYTTGADGSTIQGDASKRAGSISFTLVVSVLALLMVTMGVLL